MALFFQTIFLFCEIYDSFEMINTEKKKEKRYNYDIDCLLI